MKYAAKSSIDPLVMGAVVGNAGSFKHNRKIFWVQGSKPVIP